MIIVIPKRIPSKTAGGEDDDEWMLFDRFGKRLNKPTVLGVALSSDRCRVFEKRQKLSPTVSLLVVRPLTLKHTILSLPSVPIGAFIHPGSRDSYTVEDALVAFRALWPSDKALPEWVKDKLVPFSLHSSDTEFQSKALSAVWKYLTTTTGDYQEVAKHLTELDDEYRRFWRRSRTGGYMAPIMWMQAMLDQESEIAYRADCATNVKEWLAQTQWSNTNDALNTAACDLRKLISSMNVIDLQSPSLRKAASDFLVKFREYFEAVQM